MHPLWESLGSPLLGSAGRTDLSYTNAVQSTIGGGETSYITKNLYYDVLHTAIPSFTLPNTVITSTFLGADATQPILNSTAQGYTKDTRSTTITLNDNNSLGKSKIVASGINESEEMGSSKSFSLTCQLNSTANNVSPVLDVDTMGAIVIQNRIKLTALLTKLLVVPHNMLDDSFFSILPPGNSHHPSQDFENGRWPRST